MNDYCKEFKGSYCEHIKMHVPLSWCKERCLLSGKKENEIYKSDFKLIKHKPLTLAKLFVDAMRKWRKAGYPTVSRQEWRARLAECKKCDTKLQCPICGCQIHAKALLQTEKCPMAKWK